MDFEIQCDDLAEEFEPTAEDYAEGDLIWSNPEWSEEEDDFSDLMQYQSSFFGLVDSLNGYEV